MSKQTDLLNLTDAITVDSSNNVGIGVSDPSANLHIRSASPVLKVSDSSASGAGPIIRLQREDTSIAADDRIGEIEFYSNDASGAGASPRASVGAYADDQYQRVGIQFRTAPFNSATPVERMCIDSSGRVTMPYQPAFRAHTYTPMSGEAPIIFTVAAHNIGSHYNVSNGKFTAPVAGVYHFDFSVLMAATSSTGYVRVLFSVNSVYGQTRNGDTLTGGVVGAFTDYTYHAVQMSHSFYLSANDTVGIINGNPNGQTYQSGGNYGSFSGYLIG